MGIARAFSLRRVQSLSARSSNPQHSRVLVLCDCAAARFICTRAHAPPTFALASAWLICTRAHAPPTFSRSLSPLTQHLPSPVLQVTAMLSLAAFATTAYTVPTIYPRSQPKAVVAPMAGQQHGLFCEDEYNPATGHAEAVRVHTAPPPAAPRQAPRPPRREPPCSRAGLRRPAVRRRPRRHEGGPRHPARRLSRSGRRCEPTLPHAPLSPPLSPA